MPPTNAICRVLPMRPQTGKRPQAPSNRPLQSIKRQGNMTFGQPRKLCLLGGVLPRPIVSTSRKEYLSIFSRAIFSTSRYFRERPIFGVLGRFEGAFDLARPHVRACTSRKTGPFVAFPLFRRSRCPVPTTRKAPGSHRQCVAESRAIRLPRSAPSRGGGIQKRDGLCRSSNTQAS